MKCPKCNLLIKDSLGKFSIEKTNKCPTCYNEWLKLPENDTDLIKFEIEYSTHADDYAYIYAKDEEEARKQFEEHFSGEYTDVNYVREIKRPGFGGKGS